MFHLGHERVSNFKAHQERFTREREATQSSKRMQGRPGPGSEAICCLVEIGGEDARTARR